MKSLWVALMLAITSTSVMAEWHRLIEEKDTTFYFDPAMVRRVENGFKALILMDFKKPQDDGMNGFFSMEILREFDCKEKRVRTLAYLSHSMNMGTGSRVYANSENDIWMPASSGKINVKLMEILCDKDK